MTTSFQTALPLKDTSQILRETSRPLNVYGENSQRTNFRTLRLHRTCGHEERHRPISIRIRRIPCRKKVKLYSIMPLLACQVSVRNKTTSARCLNRQNSIFVSQKHVRSELPQRDRRIRHQSRRLSHPRGIGVFLIPPTTVLYFFPIFPFFPICAIRIAFITRFCVFVGLLRFVLLFSGFAKYSYGFSYAK